MSGGVRSELGKIEDGGRKGGGRGEVTCQCIIFESPGIQC